MAPPHIKELGIKRCSSLQNIYKIKKTLEKCHKIQILAVDEDDERLVTLEMCLIICRTLPCLTSLSMVSCSSVTDAMIQLILLHCATLKHLDIASTEITDNAFHIKTSETRFSPKRSPKKKRDSPCSAACNLASINISGCKSLTNTCVRYIAQLFGSHLQTFNASWTEMDCSILWYLAGYNLATAVQLAVSQDGEVLDREVDDERIVSDLIRHKKMLEEKITKQNSKDDSDGEGDHSNGQSTEENKTDQYSEVDTDPMNEYLAHSLNDINVELEGSQSAVKLNSGNLAEGGDDDKMEQDNLESLKKMTDEEKDRATIKKLRACGIKISDLSLAGQIKFCKRREDGKTKEAVERTQLFQPNLTSLDISNITFDNHIGDACLQDFFSANRSLKKFCISWPMLKNSTLDWIISNSPDLNHLALVDCDAIRCTGLCELASKCPKLECLDIGGVNFLSDAGLAPVLVNHESNLNSLYLAEVNITDKTLHTIAQFLGSQLINLDISWCEDVTDSGLLSIAKSCTSLASLKMRKCPASDIALITISENCPNIKQISLSGADKITNAGITVMAKSLSWLVFVDISWNSNLTDASISALFSSCSNLLDVNLAGLKCITSKPFLPIIADLNKWRRCQALLRLKAKESAMQISGFSSDEEFEDLHVPRRSISYIPRMSHIDLEYCDKINDQQMAEIVAVCRGTLSIKDYYGQKVEPKLLHLQTISR
uniref:Uncharacterized protein LOC102802577 n=1 Tax=Saccoglossus kowalevskii TaxID=10224 RepID=A0ABM0M005_SACKO|nr:PREDICTED: uncharacterized protein LOC102802577 [Saccoglossus kowalevskii]